MEKSNKKLDKMWFVIITNYYSKLNAVEFKERMSTINIEPIDTTYCLVTTMSLETILFSQNYGFIQTEIVVDDEWT